MPGLHLHRSNHLESLSASLTGVIRQPLQSVLQPEVIAVQSVGMRRWLALRIAEQVGITMNCEFPFPATLAHMIFRGAFHDVGETAVFGRDALEWRIMALLPEVLNAPDAEPVRAYLDDQMPELRRFQLSAQIAGVFDRYLLQRADQLVSWQRGESDGWQARLWRELTREHPGTSPPALLRRLLDAPAKGGRRLRRLPERISVFGVSSLSPFYVHLLDAASRCVDIHLFLFEPTDQYIGDIRSQREQDRFLRRHGDGSASAEDFNLDSGNPLLASMGKAARVFSRIIQDLEPQSFDESFQSPGRSTLLRCVQDDIFELRDRRTEEAEREAIPTDDRSVQIHCCHGPMREVEVLYDHLLDLFERIPDLTPKDILVMTPEIEAYAPFIEAVFGCPEDEALRIPFTLADRQMQAEAPVAQCFANLLELHGSRFGVTAILGLLEFGPLRTRFGIEESDIAIIRDWVEQAGIRWGIDADHRATFDLPPFDQNSWRAGLDRLLLGYAMPGDGRHLYEGMLPIAEVDGSRANVLGRFVDFAEKLFVTIPDLAASRTLPEWAETFRTILTTFFDETDENADEVARIRTVFSDLEAAATYFAEAVPLQVIRSRLLRALGDTDSGYGFLAGHTTFCSLKPMRSVPFRVVCVLGLNDTAFPRRDVELAFDLVSSHPAEGDRTRRDDDRQLFLETLLSAREVLYLSYSGLSLRDDSESPPSVVVSELLDYIDTNYTPENGASARSQVVTKHRLQAFSPAYFASSDRLFSYSAENCHAMSMRGTRDGTRTPFVDEPLRAPEPALTHVTLENLAAFLCSPARMFIKERLGIRLPENPDALDDREPLELNALERTQLCEEIIQHTRDGMPAEQILELIRASGSLPLAWSGDTEFHQVMEEAGGLLSRVQPFLNGDAFKPVDVDLQIGDWRLTGHIRELRHTGAVRFRGAAVKAKDLLRAWVSHLALLAAAPAGYPDRTCVFGIPKEFRFEPIDNPKALLGDLIDLYSKGLSEPVAFFPETSKAYAKYAWPAEGGGDPQAAWEEALKAWESSRYPKARAGESEDEFVRLAFRSEPNPLDDRWMENTRRVYQPMLKVLREGMPE